MSDINNKRIEVSSRIIEKFIKTGNSLYFQKIMDTYKARLYSYLFRKLSNNKADVDDMYQEVWLKIAKSLQNGKYNDIGKFSNFLFFVATNSCYDFYRKYRNENEKRIDFDKKKTEGGNKGTLLENVKGNDPNPEEISLKLEQVTSINELINKLPEKQKEVVLLRGEGFSFKEISEMKKVSINSLLSRMRYAVEKIRNSVNN